MSDVIHACRDCTKRYIGCHAHCESYAKRREMCDDVIKKREQEQLLRQRKHYYKTSDGRWHKK